MANRNIVVIGASAGGLEPLQDLVSERALPVNIAALFCFKLARKRACKPPPTRSTENNSKLLLNKKPGANKIARKRKG